MAFGSLGMTATLADLLINTKGELARVWRLCYASVMEPVFIAAFIKALLFACGAPIVVWLKSLPHLERDEKGYLILPPRPGDGDRRSEHPPPRAGVAEEALDIIVIHPSAPHDVIKVRQVL